MDQKTKNAQISKTVRATKEKRKQQVCKVRTLKLSRSKLTKQQLDSLERLFAEAKWVRNYALSIGYKNYDTKSKTVQVKLRDNSFETREVTQLSSQMKQSVIQQLHNDVLNLSKKKDKGSKVGKLKYKSEVNSINLKQPGTTYRIVGNRVFLQGFKKQGFKLRGVEQLKGWEVANAKLVKKADNYYLAVTCYKNREDYEVQEYVKGTLIGVDLGVSTHVTLSDGSKWNSTVREGERLKRLQRKLSRQQKGSNNRLKTMRLIRREYEKLDNQKFDLANKLVHGLLQNEVVFVQDEQLASWRKRSGYCRGGKRLQHSALGRVKQLLVSHERVVVLRKNAPTTQLCVCGCRTKHAPDQRVYVCQKCGYSGDRDVHAAQNMIMIGQDYDQFGRLVPAVRGDFKPVERVLDYEENLVLFQQLSAKQEAARASVSP